MSEKELTREEARWELGELLSKAFDTIVVKRPEAVQTVVIAQWPAKKTGNRPEVYFVACYLERTRTEDALDAILGPEYEDEKPATSPKGYWEFDYLDGPVVTKQLKATTKIEYNIKGMLTIRYKGHDFVFNNGGTKDTYKAAISDSFKRCCGDAGFTRKFWQQKVAKVQYTPEVEKLFRYGNPTLKELGGSIDKQSIFLSKSTHLKTLSNEEFLALEEPKEIPDTMMIESGKSKKDLVVSRYFTKQEIREFSEKNIDEELIRTELEHRNNFVYSYSPKSPLIFSQLSKMKAKVSDEEWKKWKEEAKKQDFKKVKDDKQLRIIAEFAFEIEDPKKILEPASKKGEG